MALRIPSLVALTTALTVSLAPPLAYANEPDIVETAIAAGDFSTLAAALEAADLVSTLHGDGPFTVFAPTDAAFAALPEAVVADLLKPESIKQLRAVLTYHVVPGKVMSTDLRDGMEAVTVQGSPIVISLGNGVMINGANVVAADIGASNGVIHVIDKVILPQ